MNPKGHKKKKKKLTIPPKTTFFVQNQGKPLWKRNFFRIANIYGTQKGKKKKKKEKKKLTFPPKTTFFVQNQRKTLWKRNFFRRDQGNCLPTAFPDKAQPPQTF